MSQPPILYSFRRCPYAIRARLALFSAGINVELREVLLRDKPAKMLEASAKGTVPVLVLPGGEVIDESLGVMRWALARNDPGHWLASATASDSKALIADNDGPFKVWLDKYKYADRFPEHSAQWYRSRAEPYLRQLEERLQSGPWLFGECRGLCDVALFPFVRQFAMVDREWFEKSSYRALRNWLHRQLEEPLFAAVMQKYPRWEPGQAPVVLHAATPSVVQ